MEPDRRAKLKSYAWLTTLAMLLALFVPLASAGAQDAGQDPQPTGQEAEEGGTLDATPESATNKVDEPHTIHAGLGEADTDDEAGDDIRAEVDEEGVDAESYDGGLPAEASEECQTEDEGDDHADHCDLVFNEGRDTPEDLTDDDDYLAPTPGKDRIRVYHDDNNNDQWDPEEDFDFVTKTWVDTEESDAAERLSGEDRIETAVDISRDYWFSTDGTSFDEDDPAHAQAEHVVIARADKFPDALAGTPFAVLQEAPLLLTFPESLDERTEDELQRVLPTDDDDATDVYLLGGDVALSADVKEAVEDLGYDVQRLWGLDRFDTAIEIAEETESEQDGTLDHLFIARSHEFPDALAGGAAAANVGNFDPDAPEGQVGAILLTFTDAKDPETEAFIDARENATTYALGGPVVNEYSCADPSTPPFHTTQQCEGEETADWAIFGADRQETSRAIAEFFFNGPTDAGVARGDKFPDALTGGAHIGQFNGPILLTQTGELDDDPKRYLCYTADTIETAYIYGGVFAVAANTTAEVDDAIDGAECPDFDLPGHWVGS